jgi:uncharacterized membrane protein SirB2
MKIVFIIITVLMAFGAIGEKDKERADKYLLAMIVMVIVTVLAYRFSN